MMKRYKVQPEIVLLAGTNPEIARFRIPEVKIRFNRGRMFEEESITSSKSVYNILKKIAGNMIQTQEMGLFLYLNRANKVLGYYRHTIGGTAGTIFDIKLILAGAVKCLAHGIIACHNHPSGNIQPSDADKRLTKQLKAATEVHDINLLDHIIIAKNGYFSFSDEGLNGLQGLNGLSGTDLFTRENYIAEVKKIGIENLDPQLLEFHEFVIENLDIYDLDRDIADIIDGQLEIMNSSVKANPKLIVGKVKKTAKAKKAVNVPKVKKEKSIKTPKPKKVKKEKKPKVVKTDYRVSRMVFDDDMKIIRRYVSIPGKIIPVKRVIALYKSIQKAITEERITKKNSRYHGIISDIQVKLLEAAGKAKASSADLIHFQITDHAFNQKVRNISKMEKIYDSVKLIKRYISLQGSETKEKAKNLHNEICKALLEFPDIKYSRELELIKKQLDSYINGNELQIEPPVELHGLFGIKKKR